MYSYTENLLGEEFWREVIESRVFALELQFTGANFAIALLANDDFSDPFVWAFFVVVLIAVDEQNDVGILLDGAGLSEIGVHGALIGSLFNTTIQLS